MQRRMFEALRSLSLPSSLERANSKRWFDVCSLRKVAMKTAIAYYRVSTQRQGRSDLGLEAQRTAVPRFAETESIAIVGEFTEVETGKGADALDRRPQLAAALAAARREKCPVLAAKLDRL